MHCVLWNNNDNVGNGAKLGVIKEDLARKGAEVVWVLQTSVTGAAEIAGASEVPCLWPLV